MGGVAAPTLTLDYAEPEPPLVTHEGTGLLVVGPSDYDILVSEIPVWLSATRQLSDVVRSMQVVDLPVEITCQRKLSDTTRTAYVDELPIDVVCARQLPDTVRTMYVSEVVTAVTGTGLLIVDPIGYDIVLRKVTDTIPDRRLIPSGLFAESYNPRGLLV